MNGEEMEELPYAQVVFAGEHLQEKGRAYTRRALGSTCFVNSSGSTETRRSRFWFAVLMS